MRATLAQNDKRCGLCFDVMLFRGVQEGDKRLHATPAQTSNKSPNDGCLRKKKKRAFFFSTYLGIFTMDFLLRTRVKEGYVHTIARVLTLGGLIKREQIHQPIVFIINLQQELIITLLRGQKAIRILGLKINLYQDFVLP